MQSKLFRGLLNSLLGIVALCALGMVVTMVVSFIGFTKLQQERCEAKPSIERISQKPLQTAARHHETALSADAPPKADPPSRRLETAGLTAAQKELDRQFRQFLSEQGVSSDELQATLEAPVKVTASVPDVQDDGALDPQIVQQLKMDFPVADARRNDQGEVWLRVDPAEANGLSMEELMVRAADLCGDSVTPIKVVVWVGNRPRAVQTFNGSPMF